MTIENVNELEDVAVLVCEVLDDIWQISHYKPDIVVMDQQVGGNLKSMHGRILVPASPQWRHQLFMMLTNEIKPGVKRFRIILSQDYKEDGSHPNADRWYEIEHLAGVLRL